MLGAQFVLTAVSENRSEMQSETKSEIESEIRSVTQFDGMTTAPGNRSEMELLTVFVTQLALAIV